MARLVRRFIDHYSAHIADSSTAVSGRRRSAARRCAPAARDVAVVTNKLDGPVATGAGRAHLERTSRTLVCGDTLPQRKPDAAPALHACRQLNCAIGDALFVGDSVTDVETARAAGCAVVCVRDGYNHGTPAEQLGADAVIDSLIELL